MKTEMTLSQVADFIKSDKPVIVHTTTHEGAERLLRRCAELLPSARFNGTIPQYINYWNRYGQETCYRIPSQGGIRYATLSCYESDIDYSSYTFAELLDEDDDVEIADFDITALMQMI